MGDVAGIEVEIADAVGHREPISGEFDSSSMPGLTGLIAEAASDAVGNATPRPGTGSLTLALSQHREPRFVALTGELRFECELVCQRCLELAPVNVSQSISLALCRSDAPVDALDAVAEEYERWDHDGESLALGPFIEELVLLSLPMVVAHASAEDCGALASQIGAADKQELTQTPFAGLAGLMKGE
ncbi:MAG: DUF177 domain-containing protein [Pseudomonadota bacterium]